LEDEVMILSAKLEVLGEQHEPCDEQNQDLLRR
jgi:hypothetical protein